MSDEAEKLTALERLESLLNDRDNEIASLKGKLQKQDDLDDDEAWMWTKHEISDEFEKLPVPRLEIRWSSLGRGQLSLSHNWLASYNLVYRHLLGHVVRVPIGSTRTSGGNGSPPICNGKVETPFRDGVHIQHDAWTLKLPAFAICGDLVTLIEPGTREQHASVKL